MEMDDEDVSTSTGRGNATYTEVKKRKNGSKNEFDQDVKTFREKANDHTRQASETAGDSGTSEAGVRHYDADGTFLILSPRSLVAVVAQPP